MSKVQDAVQQAAGAAQSYDMLTKMYRVGSTGTARPQAGLAGGKYDSLFDDGAEDEAAKEDWEEEPWERVVATATVEETIRSEERRQAAAATAAAVPLSSRVSNIAARLDQEARWMEHRRQMFQAGRARMELTMPIHAQASELRERMQQRRAAAAVAEAAEAAAAREAEVTEAKAADPDPNAHADFCFGGDGRPYRLARGKASRARVSGNTSALKAQWDLGLLRAHLRGESGEELELTDCGGVMRCTGFPNPFAGVGLCGLAAQPEVRAPFLDFVAKRTREAWSYAKAEWRRDGLRYASLASGELLLDLELLERIRGGGVHVAQVCLIDQLYRRPSAGVKRAAQEFADWQRATAQFCREAPAEILLFGSLEDYEQALVEGDRVDGCHIFMHCEAHWDSGAIDETRRDDVVARALVPGGMHVRLINSPKLAPASAWTSPPGGQTLKRFDDPALVACNAVIASAAVQKRVQEQAKRWSSMRSHTVDPIHEQAQVLADAATQVVEAQAPRVARVQAPLQAPERPVQPLAAREGPRAAESGWVVVHEPHAALRSRPSATAKIVGVVYTGEELYTSEEVQGGWLRVSRGPARQPLPPEAWVLRGDNDPAAGPMLRPI